VRAAAVVLGSHAASGTRSSILSLVAQDRDDVVLGGTALSRWMCVAATESTPAVVALRTDGLGAHDDAASGASRTPRKVLPLVAAELGETAVVGDEELVIRQCLAHVFKGHLLAAARERTHDGGAEARGVRRGPRGEARATERVAAVGERL